MRRKKAKDQQQKMKKDCIRNAKQKVRGLLKSNHTFTHLYCVALLEVELTPKIT